MSDLIARVQQEARRRGRWRIGDRVLVALSGGPDSVALLHILHALRSPERVELGALHIDFGLRGAESAGDRRFCEKLCGRLSVPIYVCEARPRAAGNAQDWARHERLHRCAQYADRYDFNRIAFGHTADDRAETFLLQLFRGAGPTALGGLLADREPFIRPLCEVSRADVLAFLAAGRMPFRVDRSNLRPLYRRNRVRLEVFPLLEAVFGTDPKDAFNRQVDMLALDSELLDHLADPLHAQVRRVGGEIQLAVSELCKYPSALQLRVLRRIAQSLGAAPKAGVLKALLDLAGLQPGRRLHLGSGVEAERGKDALWFYRRVAPAREVEVTLPGQTHLPDGSRIEAAAAPAAPPYPDGRFRARLALPEGTQRVSVRPVREGDRMRPFGMKGRRLVMDLLAEAGVPRHARSRRWVLTDGREIYWLLGQRLAEPARVVGSRQRVYDFVWDAESYLQGRPPGS